MFEDILGILSPPLPSPPELPDVDFKGCPFCGGTSIEEDGEGVFPTDNSYTQSMMCNKCGGKWTVEYDEDLDVTNVWY